MSDWKIVDKEFRIHVVIPANTTAQVSLPIADSAQVRVQGASAIGFAGISFLSSKDHRTTWNVESGEYHFSGPLSK